VVDDDGPLGATAFFPTPIAIPAASPSAIILLTLEPQPPHGTPRGVTEIFPFAFL
jgi:hypothetical protein